MLSLFFLDANRQLYWPAELKLAEEASAAGVSFASKIARLDCANYVGETKPSQKRVWIACYDLHGETPPVRLEAFHILFHMTTISRHLHRFLLIHVDHTSAEKP